MKILKTEIDPKQVAKEIKDFIISQVTEAKANGCVVGLSGGVDSTTAAYLAQLAFNEYNCESLQFYLYGLIMPDGHNGYNDAKNAIVVANNLKSRYRIIDISSVLQTRKDLNPEIFNKKYHYGNAAARERMIHLYGEAASRNLLVLGTGNKDEDFSIGYFTKYGDGGVDISPLGNLSKRLVRILAAYIGVPDKTIHSEPSARLWEGQTDRSELGYDYDPHIETVIEGFEQSYTREEIHKITGFSYQTIDDIRNRHIKNKHKMIMPPVAKISLNYR